MAAREEIAELQAALEQTFERVVVASNQPAPCTLDTEVQSDLAKYLCVLTCGFLEEAVERIVSDYCAQAGDPRMQQYMRMETERFRNPSQQAILELAGRFDDGWKLRLRAFFQQTEYQTALEGLLAVRHAVVHGRTAITTVAAAHDYLERIKVTVRFMIDLILPGGAAHS